MGPVGIPFRIQTLLVAVADSVHSQVRDALWTRHGRAMGALSFGIVEFLDLNATRLGARNGPVPVRFCKKMQSPLNLQKTEVIIRNAENCCIDHFGKKLQFWESLREIVFWVQIQRECSLC